MFHFNIDPAVLIYLLFIAVFLFNAFFKKGRRPPPTQTAPSQPSEPLPQTIPVPQPPAPALPKAAETKPPRPSVQVLPPDTAGTAKPMASRRLYQEYPQQPERIPAGPKVTQGMRGARFNTRDDLRHAIVARLVIGPPKSLQ
nr:hypothetical protein NCPCFENI_00596 [Cupriavidus sp.]